MVNYKNNILSMYYGSSRCKKNKKAKKNNKTIEKINKNQLINLDISSENENDGLDILKKMIHKKDDNDSKIERDNNHIYFYSEVDRMSVYELCLLINEAEEESIITSYKLGIEKIPIYIHISSFGGLVHAALTAIDTIQACKVPVYTIIDGATASAGTLISIVGEKRYIRPNAKMLIHQLSAGFWGKMCEIEDEYSNLKDMMDTIKGFYKDHTKMPQKELNELLKKDLWLSSEKCIKYGLVDELWK
jgi:ATP-dependent Clp endopeptidase proteolytic subunit ClpP